MSKKLRKIPIVETVNGKQRTYEVRRETNEEVMQHALNVAGKIRVRVSLHIYDNRGSYVGYQGSGIIKEVGSIAEARKLRNELHKFIGG